EDHALGSCLCLASSSNQLRKALPSLPRNSCLMRPRTPFGETRFPEKPFQAGTRPLETVATHDLRAKDGGPPREPNCCCSVKGERRGARRSPFDENDTHILLSGI